MPACHIHCRALRVLIVYLVFIIIPIIGKQAITAFSTFHRQTRPATKLAPTFALFLRLLVHLVAIKLEQIKLKTIILNLKHYTLLHRIGLLGAFFLFFSFFPSCSLPSVEGPCNAASMSTSILATITAVAAVVVATASWKLSPLMWQFGAIKRRSAIIYYNHTQSHN